MSGPGTTVVHGGLPGEPWVVLVPHEGRTITPSTAVADLRAAGVEVEGTDARGANVVLTGRGLDHELALMVPVGTGDEVEMVAVVLCRDINDKGDDDE